jgi:alpha-beta hydrolase superfamily lysophospholipase
MKEDTGYFEGVDRIQLFYKTWIPDDPPKAVLAIIHGSGEHLDRYKNLVDALVPAGFMLAGYDQRGHGRSEGQRCHVNSWDEYRGDLRIFINKVNQMVQDRSLFLLGHSLGSLIVLDYIIHHSDGISGAILSGTSLDPADAAPPFLKLLAKALSGIYPAFTLEVPFPGKSLSRDPQVAKAYDEDPLVHRDRTARWGTECLKVIDQIETNPDKINIPVLFVHGEKDPVVTVDGAQRFFDRINYDDKSIHIYKDNLHEPHNDLDYMEVISDIEKWLVDHSSGA